MTRAADTRWEGRAISWLRLIAFAVGGLIVAFAGWGWWTYQRLPSVPAAGGGVEAAEPLEWPAARAVPLRHWSAFRTDPASSVGVLPGGNATNCPLRLAGIFVAMEETGAAGLSAFRKAIIDDLVARRQYLVGEQEMAGPARVLRIFNNHVLIQYEGHTRELWLTFAGKDRTALAGAGAAAVTPAGDAEPEPLEVSKYGRRVGDTRWIMKREALMSFYREMLDNPERIAKLYETFKPDYAEGRVSGYRLGIEGEKDFLEGVGLREGDVVRKVNSMNMTSQSRAEFFIGEFVKERLGAVVLDIERDGEPRKLVYLIP